MNRSTRTYGWFDFLMTYGWAILIVLAAIAALYYYGVINPPGATP